MALTPGQNKQNPFSNPPIIAKENIQVNTQLLDQLNITLRNIVDTYERLGRGSVSLKRAAEQVAERIGVECNVQVRTSSTNPPGQNPLGRPEVVRP